MVMKSSNIVLVAAVLVVVALLLLAVTDEAIPVDTNDADYELVLGMNYKDGTTAHIKRFKALAAYHDDKLVESVSISVDVKFKAKSEHAVRVVSPRDDPDHMTRLDIYYSALGNSEHISGYPLSSFTGADYSKLERGKWYHLFADVEVTMAEVMETAGLAVHTQFRLVFELTVWYSLDAETREIAQHTIKVSVPLEFPVGGGMTNEDPEDRDDRPPGSGKLTRDTRIEPIIPDKPIVEKKQGKKSKLGRVPWSIKEPDDANDNLDTRKPGWFG